MAFIHHLALQDGAIAFLWLLVNFYLACVVWRLAGGLAVSHSLAERVLCATLSGCALITVTLLGLGACGLFFGSAMLVGVALMTLTVDVMLRSRFVSAHTAMITSAAMVRPFSSSLWVMGFGLLAGHSLINGLLQFPTDFDCLMYHLPLLDHWLQAHNLMTLDAARWSTPGGSELLAAWCCGPFTGDFLAPLNNWPAVVIWAAATLEYSRLLGLGRGWSELTTVSTLLVYTTFHETDDASNDLLVVACFMATAVYGLQFAITDRLEMLVLAGISWGLLYGVKFFAVGYAAVAGTALLITVGLLRGWKTALWAGLIMVVVSFPLGGYWYARNVLATGLPLYPMGAPSVLGYPNLWSTTLAGNRHPELWPLFFQAIWRAAGPIHWLATMAIPLLIPTLMLPWLRAWWRSGEGTVSAIAGVNAALHLGGSALIVCVLPYLVEDQPETLNHLKWAYTPLRYGLCCWTLAVIGAYALAQACCAQLPARQSQLAFWLLSLGGLWHCTRLIMQYQTEFRFVNTALLGLDIGICLLVIAWVIRRVSRPFLVVSTLGVLLSIGIGATSLHWHRGYRQHFDTVFGTDAFSVLEASTYDGASICVLDLQPYPFFGSRRQHAVINPRRYDSAEWLEQLAQERGIQIVTTVVSHKHSRFRGAADYLDPRNDRIHFLSYTPRFRVALLGPLATTR